MPTAGAGRRSKVRLIVGAHGTAPGVPQQILSGPELGLEEELTEREIHILQCLAYDMSTAEIAEHLIFSPWTVRAHLKKIRLKLHKHTRAGIVAEAMRKGKVV